MKIEEKYQWTAHKKVWMEESHIDVISDLQKHQTAT